MIDVSVIYQNREHKLSLVVVPGGPNILGMNWLREIRLNWRDIQAKLHNVSSTQSPLNDVLHRYEHPWEWPERPWSRIHIDHVGPYHNQLWFIIVDAHSKWLDIYPVSSTNSQTTIDMLRVSFSTHGLPEIIVSNNAASFTSAQFAEFCDKNRIHHVTSAPYHPASNELVERAVQSFKRGFDRMGEGSSKTKLARFLLQYRNAPQGTTGQSPAELLMGRRLRSHPDIVHPNLSQRVQRRQRCETEQHDQHARERSIEIGDRVNSRNFSGKPVWLSGVVTEISDDNNCVISRHQDNVRGKTDVSNPPDIEQCAVRDPAHHFDLLPAPLQYFCKMFTKLKRLTKSKYYTDIFYMNIGNVKRTWQILREVLNRQPNHNKQNELFVIGNSETNNKQDIANGFNTFFANIGKTINDQIIQPPEVYSDFLNGNYPINCFFQPTHEEEVIKVAQNLKTKTSQGFDNLSTCIIQKTMKEVAAPLTHIFNQSFLLGVVPDQMKIAKIVPVFKAGNKKILTNYRPISILPAFSKILEKLASIRLINFLESQDILYKHQYGFRQHYSTIHPILHLLNDISNGNDNKSKDITLAIFLDMSKAFDTISHDILIRKLEHYGIRGTCKDWFASYLTNRFQYTEIHGEQSTYLNINTGVPQSSILGPILFLIYVNDIKNCSNLNILCFADDTTAYKSGPNIEDLITNVNIQLELLYTWLCCNKLSLNINKTSYTIFKPQSNAHHNLNNNLLINHEAIKSSEESTKAGTAKFLGIYIDKHLTWSQHIDQLCTSISKSVFAINRVKYILPYAALRALYFSLVQSRLQYGIEAWGN